MVTLGKTEVVIVGVDNVNPQRHGDSTILERP